MEKWITHQKKVICNFACAELPAIFLNFSLLVEYQFCTNSKHEIAGDTV